MMARGGRRGGWKVEDTLKIPDRGGAAGSAEQLLLLSLPPGSKVWGYAPAEGMGGGGTHRDGTHGAGVSRSPPPLKLLSSTPKKRLTPPPPPPPKRLRLPLRTRSAPAEGGRYPGGPPLGPNGDVLPGISVCPPVPPPRPRPRLPAPPFSNTDSPSEPGEICQQFSTALVMTFLESASDGCKDRKAPRLSAWNNRSSVQSPIPLFSSFLPICPPPPPRPVTPPTLFPAPETRATSCRASLLSEEARAPFSPLCAHLSNPTFLSKTRKICKACTAAEKQDKV